MSPRQELQPRSEKKKKEVLTRCRRWKRELWGCRSHRLRQELRLRQGCRQGNRTSRWRLGLGSAGTLAGGSSSLPGGEVGCVKQTISSQSDGYRQLRCLLDLAQDEPISQNPPAIACHPDDQPTCHNLHCLCREKRRRGWRVPANLLLNPWKAFVPPATFPKASFPGRASQQPVWLIDSSCRGREAIWLPLLSLSTSSFCTISAI